MNFHFTLDPKEYVDVLRDQSPQQSKCSGIMEKIDFSSFVARLCCAAQANPISALGVMGLQTCTAMLGFGNKVLMIPDTWNESLALCAETTGSFIYTEKRRLLAAGQPTHLWVFEKSFGGVAECKY